MKKALIFIFTAVLCITVFQTRSYAQFKSEAFSQSYATEDSADTTESSMFSLKDFYRQLTHKDSIAKVGTLFAGSTVLIGGQQIYQRQYWKLPVIYGGIGAGIGMGIHYRGLYNKSLDAYNAAFELDPETTLAVDTKSRNLSRLMFAASGAIYWATLMDGVYNFERDTYPHAGKAAIYSLLLPGLGQAYNHEYWKIPIYWGGLLGAGHFWSLNRTNFQRFRRIYLEASDPESGYNGSISASTAQYYRDVYRRYRDYSVLAFAAVYLIQVIDANIFAYMQDFEITDDLSLNISPTIITPDLQFASNFGLGMSVGFRF